MNLKKSFHRRLLFSSMFVSMQSNAMEAPKAESNPINMFDRAGYAPIHRALELGDKALSNELVQLLLMQKVDVNISTQREGMTPLHVATQQIQNGAYIIPHLLAARANICATDVHGRTPLALAVANGNIEATKLLLQASTENATSTTVNPTPPSGTK